MAALDDFDRETSDGGNNTMKADLFSFGSSRLVLAALLIAGPGIALAQDNYPSRTIKIVVPVPPGPMLDALPRIIANKLASRWGQPVIIENRPGAGQNLGAEVVARAAPDGYTLLTAPAGPLAISHHFHPKLGFDPNAFVPVTVLVTTPNVLVVNPKLPVSTLQELITYAKTNSGKITYGSPGAGSPPHLAAEMLTQAAGVRMVHVPYQGMGPAQRDLLAGHVDVMIDNLGNVWPHVMDSRLRVVAATTETRIPELPNVAAIAETYPGYAYSSWFAVVAPPKTPPAIAAKLSQAIAETLTLPDVAKRLRDYFVTPVGSSPAETATFITSESERWGKVITSSGNKLD